MNDNAELENKFFDAVIQGDLISIEKMIDNGFDVNKVSKCIVEFEDDYGDKGSILKEYIPLFVANSEVAKLLIEKGADVEIKDINGYTPLIACTGVPSYFGFEKYDIDKAELLIAMGADVNNTNNNKETVLAILAENSKNIFQNGIDFADLLIDSGANIDSRDYSGATPLMRSSTDTMTNFLIDNGADVNAVNKEGKTPLMQGDSYRNHAEAAKQVKTLISKGSNVNAVDFKGKTALFYYTHLKDAAKHLVEAGIDINHENNNGYTAVGYSLSKDLSSYLLENGAVITSKDEGLIERRLGNDWLKHMKKTQKERMLDKISEIKGKESGVVKADEIAKEIRVRKQFQR